MELKRDSSNLYPGPVDTFSTAGFAKYSIGEPIHNLGEKVFRDATDILKQKRKQEGEEAAARVPVPVDANGNVVAPNYLGRDSTFGPTIFDESYNAVIHDKIRNAAILEGGKHLSDIHRQYQFDPKAFDEVAQDYRNRVVNSVPADIAVELDAQLGRLQIGHYSDIADNRYRRDFKEAAELNSNQITREVDNLSNLALRGDFKSNAWLDAKASLDAHIQQGLNNGYFNKADAENYQKLFTGRVVAQQLSARAGYHGAGNPGSDASFYKTIDQINSGNIDVHDPVTGKTVKLADLISDPEQRKDIAAPMVKRYEVLSKISKSAEDYSAQNILNKATNSLVSMMASGSYSSVAMNAIAQETIGLATATKNPRIIKDVVSGLNNIGAITRQQEAIISDHYQTNITLSSVYTTLRSAYRSNPEYFSGLPDIEKTMASNMTDKDKLQTLSWMQGVVSNAATQERSNPTRELFDSFRERNERVKKQANSYARSCAPGDLKCIADAESRAEQNTPYIQINHSKKSAEALDGLVFVGTKIDWPSRDTNPTQVRAALDAYDKLGLPSSNLSSFLKTFANNPQAYSPDLAAKAVSVYSEIKKSYPGLYNSLSSDVSLGTDAVRFYEKASIGYPSILSNVNEAGDVSLLPLNQSALEEGLRARNNKIASFSDLPSDDRSKIEKQLDTYVEDGRIPPGARNVVRNTVASLYTGNDQDVKQLIEQSIVSAERDDSYPYARSQYATFGNQIGKVGKPAFVPRAIAPETYFGEYTPLVMDAAQALIRNSGRDTLKDIKVGRDAYLVPEIVNGRIDHWNVRVSPIDGLPSAVVEEPMQIKHSILMQVYDDRRKDTVIKQNFKFSATRFGY